MIPERQQADVLIRNARVVTMDPTRRVYSPGALTIEGRLIGEVGPEREVAARTDASVVIDAHGGLVHPGFIDTHAHVSHTLLRAPCPDGIDWTETVSSLMIDFWNAIGDEDELAGSLIAATELIRAGTTCFLEPGSVFEPATTVEAAERVGIRALVGDGFLCDVGPIVHGPGQVDRAPRSTGEAISRLGRQLPLNYGSDRLARGYVAVVGSGTASRELLLAAKDVARDANVTLTMHTSWDANDRAAEESLYNGSPIHFLAQLGALDENTLLSHLNFVDDAELAQVTESSVSVSWCPVVAGLWTTGGHSRHSEILRQGCNVSLGSDSTILGNRLDLVDAARQAIVLSRLEGLSSTSLVAADALEMLTVNGARALGLEHEIGSLAAGRRADIVIREGGYVVGNAVDQLVYAGYSGGVDFVFVDGQCVFESGAFRNVDEEEIQYAARHRAEQLMRKLGWKDVGWRSSLNAPTHFH